MPLPSRLLWVFGVCQDYRKGVLMTRIEAMVAAVCGLVAFGIAYAKFSYYEGSLPVPPLYFLAGAVLGFLAVRMARKPT